jgi:hypothetical protein
VHHPALHPQRQSEVGQQLHRPPARRQHQVTGLGGTAGRPHLHPAGGRGPRLDRLVVAQLGTVSSSDGKMRQDGPLRRDEPGGWLEECCSPVRRPHRREAPSHLGRVEHLVLQLPPLGRREAAVEDAAAGPPEEDPARPRQQRLAARAQLVPQLVGPPEQRHVAGALEVGLPHDAGLAVAGAVRMPSRVLVQAEHALAPGGEVRGGGAAEPAEPGDDHVVRRHRLVLVDRRRRVTG